MSFNNETGMYEGYIYKIWNDVIDLLKQSLDNVGVYAIQNQFAA